MLKPVPTLSLTYVESEVRAALNGLTQQDIKDSEAAWNDAMIQRLLDGLQNFAQLGPYLMQIALLRTTLQNEIKALHLPAVQHTDRMIVARAVVSLVYVWWLAQHG